MNLFNSGFRNLLAYHAGSMPVVSIMFLLVWVSCHFFIVKPATIHHPPFSPFSPSAITALMPREA
jgi:hypothetical protein